MSKFFGGQWAFLPVAINPLSLFYNMQELNLICKAVVVKSFIIEDPDQSKDVAA
jgi:hypothetical protein